MALTQVTELLPGDVIDIGPNERITVSHRESYGVSETTVQDMDGNVHILANTNWFEAN